MRTCTHVQQSVFQPVLPPRFPRGASAGADAPQDGPGQQPPLRKRGRPVASGFADRVAAFCGELRGRSIAPFSDLARTAKDDRVKQTLDLVRELTGDRSHASVTELVHALAEHQGFELAHKHEGPNRNQLLDRIREAYRNSSTHSERASFVQFFSDVSHDKLTSPVFDFSFKGLGDKLLASCRLAVEQFGYGPVVIGQGGDGPGAPALPKEKVEKVHEVFEEFTRTATRSERKVLGPEVHILEKPISHICARIECMGICGYGTAWKYGSQLNLHEALTLTDFCHICNDHEKHLVQEKRWVTYFALTRYPGRGIPETGTLADLLASDALQKHERGFIIGLMIKAVEFETHRCIKDHQRHRWEADVKAQEDPDSKVILMRADYMGAIQTGVGPVNLENAYYGHSAVSCLGFVVYMPGCTEPEYYDFCSDNVAHNSAVSEMNTRSLLDMLKARHPDKFAQCERLKLWSDVGRHFLSSMYLHGTLIRIREDFGFKSVSNDFLAPLHGKGINDSHFATDSRYIRRYSAKFRIVNAADVRKALVQGHDDTVATKVRRKTHIGSPMFVEEYGETDASCGQLALVLRDNILNNYSFTVVAANPNVVEIRALTGATNFQSIPVQIVKARTRAPKKPAPPAPEAPGSPRILKAVLIEPPAKAPDVGPEGEGDKEQYLTRWARDTAPEAMTDYAKLLKLHRHIRAQVGTKTGSIMFEPLEKLSDKLKDARAARDSCLSSGALPLPTGNLAARRKFARTQVAEPGQGISMLYPLHGGDKVEGGEWTLCTLAGPSDDNGSLIEVTWHHADGPSMDFISISTLTLGCVPTRSSPTMILLDVNHFEPDTPAPPHIPLGDAGADVAAVVAQDTKFAVWALCGKCRRWRVIPRDVYNIKKKRGEKFECKDVLPQGCRAPRRKLEQTWHTSHPRAESDSD